MEIGKSIDLTYGTRAQAADASCDDRRPWLVQPRGGGDEYFAARAFEQHGCARANDRRAGARSRTAWGKTHRDRERTGQACACDPITAQAGGRGSPTQE